MSSSSSSSFTSNKNSFTNANVPDTQHQEFSSTDLKSNDISMVDVNDSHTQQHFQELHGIQDTKPNGADNLENDYTDSSSQSLTKEIEELPPLRRKSTIILTDDIEFEKLKLNQQKKQSQEDGQSSTSNQNTRQGQDTINHESQGNNTDRKDSNMNIDSPIEPPSPPEVVPTEIKWVQGGEKVYVTGSFTGWRKMIGLIRNSQNNEFSIKLSLPVGTHRFRFIVDNELRFSDYLPTATDQMGNFVNYIEILSLKQRKLLLQKQQIDEELELEDQSNKVKELYEQEKNDSASQANKSTISRNKDDSKLGLTNDEDDMGNGYSRYYENDDDILNSNKVQYITDIPKIFTDQKVMEQYYITLDNQQNHNNGGNNQQWLIPPQLPPHLESVILNNYSNDKDNNSGSLPIPNHVHLNHLATTSIKHNTLAVACVVRYKRKYVTQILYAPLQ